MQTLKQKKIKQGIVLLSLVKEYLASIEKDRNEQYVLDFCDNLNKLSVTY